jgi:adenosylcobinamide kinase/adenosylcobinamide-phosphate guanylyltransferase
MINLILGGARSGKSCFAEKLAARYLDKNDLSNNIIYIATATAGDEEMRQRIQDHQASRPKSWQLIEEPFYLSSVLEQHQKTSNIIIIECLTLWLSNWLCTNDDENWQEEKQAFMEIITDMSANLIIVSNEVGSGIVPIGNLSREFVDEAGWLNQALSQLANNVTLVVAGCPLQLKPEKPMDE